MKVLFALDALINAGAEKSTLHLISHFSKNAEVHLVYFYPRHELKQEFLNARVRLHFLGLHGKYSFVPGIRKLMKLLKDEQPDVVVSSIFRANFMCRVACKLTGTKLIGTFISDSYSNERTQSFSFTRKLGFGVFKWLDKITAGIPICWISNSQTIADSNCRELKIDKEKVIVIHRGRDASVIHKLMKPVQQASFVFISIGRLLETKGYQDIIRSFKILWLQNPNIFLKIYGEGEYRKPLQQLIAELGLEKYIKLYGNVPEGWKKIYNANCFIFSSWYEGFSGALVEAMMVGVPIIASNIPMNLEAVANEQTALVYEMKNSNELADKMQNMITNYPAMITMGARAREAAIEKFDIKKIAAQYESVLLKTARS